MYSSFKKHILVHSVYVIHITWSQKCLIYYELNAFQEKAVIFRIVSQLCDKCFCTDNSRYVIQPRQANIHPFLAARIP